MVKKKVLFLGCRELGYYALEWLLQHDGFLVVAACLFKNNEERFWGLDPREICIRESITEIDIADIPNLDFDIGLSVNYHKIIPADILPCAKQGFWNIHHSYNLRLRGRNITTHAILRSFDDNVHYHGTTIHKIVEELDAGPILASSATNILRDDTAFSLFSRLDLMALDMLKEWFPRLAFEETFLYNPPHEGVLIFKASQLPSKEVNLKWTDQKIYDHVRAFDHPLFPPAYAILDNETIELVIKPREEYRDPIKFDTHIFYTKKLHKKNF